MRSKKKLFTSAAEKWIQHSTKCKSCVLASDEETSDSLCAQGARLAKAYQKSMKDAVTRGVSPIFVGQHRHWVSDAAAIIIAIADDSGQSLVTVIAEIERYIIQETKVTDSAGKSVPKNRRGYTLVNGHIIELGPNAGKPPKVIDCAPHRLARRHVRRDERRTRS